ncbi:MAG TPA: ABC transporter ATP-binding protein [Marinobacterium sp.]|nr:ABC transporter ATP-binding protein [Marinobacterium sp.]
MKLELRDVSKRVGADIHIHETSLVFEPGAFNVLLGATNAGKTTLMKLMAGLDMPTSGQVLYGGVDMTKAPPQERNISFVHQFFINYPHLSVRDNITSPLRLAKVRPEEIKRRLDETADLLRLGPMLDRRPHELSGGQQQRCALARAIIKDSSAVFLDEPLANLDYKLREELRSELPVIFSNRGAVVVYATSEPAEALMLGGYTAAMYEGHVSQFGVTSEVYRQPANVNAAQVFSDPPLNVAQIEKRDGKVNLSKQFNWRARGVAADLPDGAYTLAVRPHFVRPAADESAQIPLHGEVRVTELSGSESVAHFNLGKDIWVSQSDGLHPYKVGEQHDFYLDDTRCFFFGADGRRVV